MQTSEQSQNMFTIRVPASSANLGPGFDVIGLALSLYLELEVVVEAWKTNETSSSSCVLSCEGVDAESVSLDPEINLITRSALYVLRCHGIRGFPDSNKIHIKNDIPLGKGLGSSAAAVVAGTLLANQLGRLQLEKKRLLSFALYIERHPDNLAPALFGGFGGAYVDELSGKDKRRKEIPLSEVLPQPAGGVDTGLEPPVPPLNLGHYKRFKWAPEIKCITIVPNFQVPTAKAREALPTSFARSDVVFNLQRLGLLVTALGESPPDPDLIFRAMQDKLHQPYRQSLIPGLSDILQSETPASHPGLLGICVSGAGPTILALATENFQSIADTLIKRFQERDISCTWSILTPDMDGATVRSKTVDQASEPRGRPAAKAGASSNSVSAPTLTYADAGVSIDRGNALVQKLKKLFATTSRPGAEVDIGGFGGFVDLKAAGFQKSPKICLGIDGIGTKLKIVFATDDCSTVGIDLVAMNVNDIVVQGAEPLCFLDYISCGNLDVSRMALFCEGVAEGCRQAGCAVVGGETAEMPDVFSKGEYDAAGVAVGAINDDATILPDRDSMVEGDILIGLGSSGPHSNGYSLIRKIVEEKTGLTYSDASPWDPERSLGKNLLAPTKIYVKSCLAVHRKNLVKGMAHITGGGLYDNIPRMLPDHLAAELDVSCWPVPKSFAWLKRAGNIDSREFARVWNTGLGMVLVVSPEKKEEAIAVLKEAGEDVYTIGILKLRGEESCILRNLRAWDF